MIAGYRPLVDAQLLADELTAAEDAGNADRVEQLTKMLAAPHPVLQPWHTELPRMDDIAKAAPGLRPTGLRRHSKPFDARMLGGKRGSMRLVVNRVGSRRTACDCFATTCSWCWCACLVREVPRFGRSGCATSISRMFSPTALLALPSDSTRENNPRRRGAMEGGFRRSRGHPSHVAGVRRYRRNARVADLVGAGSGRRVGSNGRYGSDFGVPGETMSRNGFGVQSATTKSAAELTSSRIRMVAQAATRFMRSGISQSSLVVE